MSYLYFALGQQVRTRFEAWITTEFKQLCDFCLRDTRSVPETAALLSPAELGALEASALSSLRVPRSIDSVGGPQIGLDSGRIPARGESRLVDVFADGADSCGGDGGVQIRPNFQGHLWGATSEGGRLMWFRREIPQRSGRGVSGLKAGNCQSFGESHTASCRRALAKQEVALPCVQTPCSRRSCLPLLQCFYFRVRQISAARAYTARCSLLAAADNGLHH